MVSLASASLQAAAAQIPLNAAQKIVTASTSCQLQLLTPMTLTAEFRMALTASRASEQGLQTHVHGTVFLPNVEHMTTAMRIVTDQTETAE